MKICYIHSNYRSFARTAASYKEILSTVVEIVDNPEVADAVILHEEPHHFPAYYEKIPSLASKYVIAYSVWEASSLPRVFIEGLGLVQEVWTCSEYCRNIFASACLPTYVVPHVIERLGGKSPDEVRRVNRLIGFSSDMVYLFAIASIWDRRKNIGFLLTTFKSICDMFPDARLIIKLNNGERLPLEYDHPQIVVINSRLSDGEIDHLYEISSAFVSAHCSEGWGLCLSDALLLGVPVVATAYSGNLMFMTDDNSFGIQAREDFIMKDDQYHLFTSEMKWGYPCERSLRNTLAEILDDAHSKRSVQKCRQGKIDISRFSASTIHELLVRRILGIPL